jgi:dihydrodiol dehydrogenase / D-xylose 1-dehydrogenase (NADP)
MSWLSEEDNKTVLNWGIISTGLISSDFCEALLSIKSNFHRLAGVSARKLNDAQSFANRFSIPLCFDSYEALCNHEQINIVYIGSINTTHKDICLTAIKAG